MARVHLDQHGIHDRRDIFLVVSERRHMQIEHVQPVVQITAKMAVGNCFSWIFVGCSQDSNIHWHLDLAAKPA